ncbi:MAG TPA: hypothetical protein VD971_08185 [Phycisphaerales bacterium]|nr:hypothetical protein [Phycisphaerales bacterium]
MRSMLLSVSVLACAAGVASAVGDISTVNGYRVEARIFNDQPTTNLTINGTSYPAPGAGMIAGAAGPIVFDEQFTALTPGGNTNKHVAWLSTDGGASRFGMNPGQSWDLQFNVRIDAPAGSPRKEAGIEIHNPRLANNPPFTDEGQVLIASDGEVAVFGAAMPFTGLGFIYTLGTTAHVRMQFFAAGVHHPSLGAYQLDFTDAVNGLHSSGIKIWGNEADGTIGFNTDTAIGFKAQNSRNPFINDTSVITYNNISVVPAPTAAALFGVAGLAAFRRRRA